MTRRTGGKPDSPDYGIAAVARAMDVVTAIVAAGPSTLAAIAGHAGCDRATAFRILHTLQARGLVTQDGPRGAWRLGASWLAVARATRLQRALELAAAPHMALLAAACHEAVYLILRDGQESEVAAVQPGDPNVRLYAKPGDRAPLHAGPGRLLLAHAPPAIQRAVLASRLPRLATRTRIDPPWIAGDLQRIAARGWLITSDEIEEGAVTVSAPVRDGLGEVLAVLSIASPNLRMRAPRPHMLVAGVLAAAAALGAAIGAPS